jgi:glycosyltransferase involved in cell wall biosynthesis
MTRVCHITHDLGDGGAERLLIELAEVAPTVGLEIVVVSLLPNDGQHHAAALRAMGVTVRTAGLGGQWDPRGFTRAARIVRDLDPAVIHSHQKQADLVAAYVARRLGRPLVSTLHRIEDEATGMDRVKRRLAALARTRVAARTVAVSEAQRRWYLDTFRCDPARLVTIHNGVRRPAPVTPEARRRIRSGLGVTDEHVLAAMIGVVRPGKGHAQLIAAARLLGEGSPVRFVCAGDGPLLGELRRSAADTGGRVTFTGWRSDVPDLLASSDLIVHPTLFDALPTALIQGLAAGLPAVASDVGGVPEIVDRDCGILVPPDDPAALAGAVEALAGSEDRRRAMGQRAARRFAEEFDSEIWARRLRELYDTVLGSHPVRSGGGPGTGPASAPERSGPARIH